MTAVARAPQAPERRASLRSDARDVLGRLLVGTAAGALAGILVGGLGGRIVMLVLRLTSDPVVIGVTSDDGFEIGRFTVGGTLQLLGATAALGAANGALYVVLRGALPCRARAPLWALFAAAAGGSQFVHSDGVDFVLLEPLSLAVVAFVSLPGLAALVVVLLVERWLRDDARRPNTVTLGLAAATGTIALPIAGALAAAVLLTRRLGLSPALARAGRLLVPTLLLVGTVVAGWYTVAEAAQILG